MEHQMSQEDMQEFEEWWQERGQFCRAGGGDYEKTFAFAAWRRQARGRDWYKQRCDLLQQWQSKMRDPERMIVCDILANGQTLPDEARYALPEAIKDVLTAIVSRSDAELLALTSEQLHEQWYFRWNSEASVEWNIYKFSDALEMFKRRCRQWEEHHNGSCCVVERVREKYLMPRIREMKELLKVHLDDGGER